MNNYIHPRGHNGLGVLLKELIPGRFSFGAIFFKKDPFGSLGINSFTRPGSESKGITVTFGASLGFGNCVKTIKSKLCYNKSRFKIRDG